MAFVYTITCTKNKKIYVGSTTRLLCQRWGDHKSLLRNNKHVNIHLQRSWNKYGESSFLFEELEEIDKEFVVSTEQYWINLLDVYKNGFNRNPKAGVSTGIKRSKETCDNISKTGNWKKANDAWRGSKHTNETKALIKSKRSKQVIGPRSEATKRKISETRKAKNIGNSNNQVKYSKVIAFKKGERYEFSSTKEAAEFLGVTTVNGITRVLRGERNKYKGFKWNALLKSGELMGTPEMDNHEPS